ncbi:MAG: hypothetical protein H6810_11160 [Phycisphaeraceae bacterium]|nr:MAG: hypothetical protein H6810_11160 [Phycisphaeraceae bacterium]
MRGCYAEYRRVGFPCRSHACSTIDLFGMQAGVGFINGELTEAFHGPTGAGDYEVSLSAIGGNAAVYLVLIFAAARSVQFVCTRVAASRDRSPASG